jgi:hypothetical protein
MCVRTAGVVLAGALAVAGCNPPPDPELQRKQAVQAKLSARKAEYQRDRANIHAEIETLIASGKAQEARLRSAPYRSVNDPELEALVAKADALARADQERELLAKIKSSKSSDHHARLLYYAELEKLFPDKKEYRDRWRIERAALTKVEEAARKKAEAQDRAERRKRGVTVGMSKEEVLMSSWGRPERVNSTTNSRGTREQWVYGGRNYLYFDESGRLTTIQN